MAEAAHLPTELNVVADPDQLAQAAVNEFRAAAELAITARARFTVALSGGNTPRSVYSALAAQCRDSLSWEKIFIFFGDERNVPPDDPQSNYRMAYESLLSHVPLPSQNVFRVPAELPAGEAAEEYEGALRRFFHLAPGAWPRFDLIFLGLGEDGHTASLFPGSSALEESSRLVVSNWVEKFKSFRITFTLPLVNNSAEILFLVSGGDKAEILREIFTSQTKGAYPAQRVRPRDGRLFWIVDQSAAGLFKTKSRSSEAGIKS